MSATQLKLKTDPEIINLFKETEDGFTYSNLRGDIKLHGVKVKGVVANSPDELKGTIVCGNKRYRIAQEFGIEFPYDLVDFESREAMMEYAKNDNVLRRQLTVAQQIKVEDNYIKWLQKTKQKNIGGDRKSEKSLVSIDTSIGRTRELLAKKVGTSPATAQRAMFVIKNAPKEIEQQMLQGELTISGAVKKTRRLLKKEKKEEQERLIKISSFESNVEWADYGINIYLGCYHNCSYCYGRLMNERFKRIEKWTEPKKRNIDLNDLSNKLRKLEKGSFFFCSVTDAYQPLNNQLNWAREVLEVMLNSKHHIIILTKSAFVEKDLEYIKEYKNVELGFTITCLDDNKNRKYEPNSSPPSERIRIIKKAHNMGIKTLVSIEPWIIGHTDSLEIIKKLENDVDRWIIGVHNYAGMNLEAYRPYIDELLGYLNKNNLKFRLKAELIRVIKSNPILSQKEYAESANQQVGDK